jgi:hypothetical protein
LGEDVILLQTGWGGYHIAEQFGEGVTFPETVGEVVTLLNSWGICKIAEPVVKFVTLF